MREYIQTQLTSSLISGNCYFVSFYVNEANWSGLAINKIGALFSTTPVSCPNGTFVINNNSQIKPFNNKIINDTLDWSNIKGVFQSTNSENYITIGNFNLDSTTDTLIFNSNNFAQNYSYYLIDSVTVTPIDSMPSIMSAFAGNDISINLGDSTFIGQEISNLNCEWFDASGLITSNISGIYVKPLTTSTYTVHQNLCGKDTYDSIVVTVNINTNYNEFSITNNDFIISPNPNNGIFKIEILNKKISIQNAKIKLSNIFGQEIKSFVLESKK